MAATRDNGAAELVRPGLGMLAAVVAVLLALTGCSGTTTSQGGESSTGDDSSQTGAADAEPLTSADFGKRIAAAQKKAGSFTFTQTLAAGTTKISTEGRASYGGETPDVESSTATPNGDLEAVVIDGVTYLKIPGAAKDKPWVKLDPRSSETDAEIMGDVGNSQDPTAMLRVLGEKATITPGAVTKVGGVEARRYRVSMGRADFAEASGTDPQRAKLLPQTIAFDIWVDGEDRPRKMVTDLEVGGRPSTTTLAFDDYGSDVEISAPPADEVSTDAPPVEDLNYGTSG